MAKHQKAKQDEGTGDVDAAPTAPVASAPSEPAAQPDVKRMLTSSKPVSLADLNKAAYTAHRADADVKRRAAEAGVRAMQDALKKLG